MWEAAEESFYLFSRRVPGTTRVSLMLLKTSTYDVRLLGIVVYLDRTGYVVTSSSIFPSHAIRIRAYTAPTNEDIFSTQYAARSHSNKT